jgi:hypothetical protein
MEFNLPKSEFTKRMMIVFISVSLSFLSLYVVSAPTSIGWGVFTIFYLVFFYTLSKPEKTLLNETS